eukprot:CAMPEP_0168373482 /NCGR_PEP_ID=MMETSP0228-20121227/8811_1 /TAXON_ID=133427 /ORGANISM="Protoceratium reticulatum, Strain CCCM 535 (=CCMP 1889)" /LENGTH=76 /DNA_ID=CAMNT_0008386405 /DNA_START=234 /DNA_END=464 /DNA_ORIENTATION=+
MAMADVFRVSPRPTPLASRLCAVIAELSGRVAHSEQLREGNAVHHAGRAIVTGGTVDHSEMLVDPCQGLGDIYHIG